MSKLRLSMAPLKEHYTLHQRCAAVSVAVLSVEVAPGQGGPRARDDQERGGAARHWRWASRLCRGTPANTAAWTGSPCPSCSPAWRCGSSSGRTTGGGGPPGRVGRTPRGGRAASRLRPPRRSCQSWNTNPILRDAVVCTAHISQRPSRRLLNGLEFEVLIADSGERQNKQPRPMVGRGCCHWRFGQLPLLPRTRAISSSPSCNRRRTCTPTGCRRRTSESLR